MTDNSQSTRIRVIEFLLVCAVAFSGTLLVSFNIAFFGADDSPAPTYLRTAYMIIHEVLSIAVLQYVLFRQNRRMLDLGTMFSPVDVPISIGLALIIYLVYRYAYVKVYVAYVSVIGIPPQIRYSSVIAQASILSFLFVMINPFFEELIARAFLISEVLAISKSQVYAVALSVLLQTAYHLYQGPVQAMALATGFLISSMYYVLKGRLWPLILSHLYFDVYALVAHSIK